MEKIRITQIQEDLENVKYKNKSDKIIKKIKNIFSFIFPENKKSHNKSEIKMFKKNPIWFGQEKVPANLAEFFASIKWKAGSGLFGL